MGQAGRTDQPSGRASVVAAVNAFCNDDVGLAAAPLARHEQLSSCVLQGCILVYHRQITQLVQRGEAFDPAHSAVVTLSTAMRLQTGTGDQKIASISFNDDLSCLACATVDGYGIFLTVPLERYCFRSFDGGFSIVEMFGQSNILALVGGRPSPLGFSESSVVLWDDEQVDALL